MDNDRPMDGRVPEGETSDLLTELLRTGARQLIAQAVEAELTEFLGAVPGREVVGWPGGCGAKRLPARA